MSVTFGSLVQGKPDRSALFVCMGMLMATLLLIALNAHFGSTYAMASVVGP